MQEHSSDALDRLAEIEALAEQIGQNAALCDSLDHKRLTALRRFDELGGWAVQGCRTCAHWVSWRVGLSLGPAREQLRVAHALARLPLIDGAFGRAELSYSKVRGLTRVATPENEATLLELARQSTASQVERICRAFQAVVDPGKVVVTERFVRRRDLESGMVRLDLQLLPEEAAVVMKALAVATRLAYEGDPRVGAHTPVDSLVRVCESFLAHAAKDASVPSRFEVSVNVPAETLEGDRGLGELADGSPLLPETTRRLACNAAIVKDGRRTRSVPAALRRALEQRDKGCRFPGCTNRIFVDAHHITHWAHGGPTTLENLTLLCNFHHVLVHEGGFRSLTIGGKPVFLDPRGREVETVPPVDALAQLPDDVDLDANYPRWDGSRLDLGAAIDALLDQAEDCGPEAREEE